MTKFAKLDRHGLLPSHANKVRSTYISCGCQVLVRDDVMVSEAQQSRVFHAVSIDRGNKEVGYILPGVFH